jgi:hypothetical protein
VSPPFGGLKEKAPPKRGEDLFYISFLAWFAGSCSSGVLAKTAKIVGLDAMHLALVAPLVVAGLCPCVAQPIGEVSAIYTVPTSYNRYFGDFFGLVHHSVKFNGTPMTANRALNFPPRYRFVVPSVLHIKKVAIVYLKNRLA